MTQIAQSLGSEHYQPLSTDLVLADECARFHNDPLGWVLWAFDWGHAELRGFDGPDEWQRQFLSDWGEWLTAHPFDGVIPVGPYRTSTKSGHGVGKAQRLDDLVPTPQGIRRWGDLKPGDRVFDEHGAPVRILQTHRYRQTPMYRVTFDDGSHLDVSSGHLWSVRGRRERRYGFDTWRTLETAELLKLGVKRPNGSAMARQWEIPVQGAVQFQTREVPVHPYLLGVWLGDGVKGVPRYSKPHTEVADRLRNLGYEVTDEAGGANKYIRNVKHLFTDPVFQCASHERYIPDDYKFNTVESRMELFRGLCDTDGGVHGSGSIGYSTTSKRLADDVVWLARSLGFKAMLQSTVTKGWYPDGGGRRVECRDCYRVTINASINPFTIEHRREAYKPSEPRYQKRWIDSVEPIGHEDCMCISVDSPTGLYQARDFIVTHNSSLVSWIILFIMSTRPKCKGVVTANTGEQLRTKTWAELAKWKGLCIVGHWFELNATSLQHRAWPEDWRVDAQTCREENSEAFAGLHAASSSPFFIFDEAAGIPDVIWEVAEGGLTDGQSFMFAFGNPTRNTGKFYQTYGNAYWRNYSVDSRRAARTNKALIAQWEEEYGEDSDFFRVRVKGEFPRAGDMQFIPGDVVAAARKRGPGRYLGTDPLICGIDVARGGDDNCYIQFRRGYDAKSEVTYKIPGEKARDSMQLVSKLTLVLNDHKPDQVFLDATGIGGPVADRLRQLGYNVTDVHFGGAADDDRQFANKVSEMGWRLRQWLIDGGAIPDDGELEDELTARLFWHDKKGRFMVEPKAEGKEHAGMKKRLGKSPDWGDALYLTFAHIVPALQQERGVKDAAPWARDNLVRGDNTLGYNPLDALG